MEWHPKRRACDHGDPRCEMLSAAMSEHERRFELSAGSSMSRCWPDGVDGVGEVAVASGGCSLAFVSEIALARKSCTARLVEGFCAWRRSALPGPSPAGARGQTSVSSRSER